MNGVIEKTLKKVLDNLNGHFYNGNYKEDSELAYLALTGKFENTIRDKFGFLLHKSLQNPDLKIMREWHNKKYKLGHLFFKQEVHCLTALVRLGFSWQWRSIY